MLKSAIRLLIVTAGIAVIAGAVHSGSFAPSSAAAAGDPTACVAALRADRLEALRIGQEETDNFNATAVGSPYENALVAYHLALVTARTDFYKAFRTRTRARRQPRISGSRTATPRSPRATPP